MHDDFGVYKKVRGVIGTYHSYNCDVLVNVGDIITDTDKKKEAWKPYLKKLSHEVREEQELRRAADSN